MIAGSVTRRTGPARKRLIRVIVCTAGCAAKVNQIPGQFPEAKNHSKPTHLSLSRCFSFSPLLLKGWSQSSLDAQTGDAQNKGFRSVQYWNARCDGRRTRGKFDSMNQTRITVKFNNRE